MFKVVQKKRSIWLRAVAVTAAILAIIVSAIVVSPGFNYSDLPTQPNVVSTVDAIAADDGLINVEPDADCHKGYGCTVAIVPGRQIALARFDRASEFFRVPDYQPSGLGYLLFHPPRTLSLV